MKHLLCSTEVKAAMLWSEVSKTLDWWILQMFFLLSRYSKTACRFSRFFESKNWIFILHWKIIKRMRTHVCVFLCEDACVYSYVKTHVSVFLCEELFLANSEIPLEISHLFFIQFFSICNFIKNFVLILNLDRKQMELLRFWRTCSNISDVIVIYL